MPGGNVGTGIAVDLATHFRSRNPLEVENGTLQVGAGVTAQEVEQAARGAGLRFPPLPSSARWCTVGGMLACNAAGTRSYRYGPVREWVAEVQGLLPNGAPFRWAADPWASEANTGGARAAGAEAATAASVSPLPGLADLDPGPLPWPQVRKNASGYELPRFLESGNPLHLLVGSEGTLALITGARLKLTALPEQRGVAVVGLPSSDALAPTLALAESGRASACEFLGRRLLEMLGISRPVRGHRIPSVSAGAESGSMTGSALLAGFPPDLWGLVILETEDRESQDALRDEARRLGLPFLLSTRPVEMDALWHLRKGISPLIRDRAESGFLSTQFIEDSVVPPDRLPAYIEGVEVLLAQEATDHVLFGHAGDGNLHLNPLLNVRDGGWRERAMRLLEGTVELVGRLGGTLSGEHGDGQVRAPYLEAIFGPRIMASFQCVKRAFDPQGILNPGVILPSPGKDPLAGLHAGLLWEKEERGSLKEAGYPVSSTFGLPTTIDAAQ